MQTTPCWNWFLLSAWSGILLLRHGGHALVLSVSSNSNSSPFPPILPSTPDQIARAAASAVHAAWRDGIYRQSIKLPLSEPMYGSKEEGFVADRAIGWQGGPQETLRYLTPLTMQVLQRLAPQQADTAGLAPRIQQQFLLDFDGSCLLTSEHPAGALYDVQAVLQPNTDDYYGTTIANIETQATDRRLVVLVNPAWRDRTSWGFFQRQEAQRLILDRFVTSFALDEFVVRGNRISRWFQYGGDHSSLHPCQQEHAPWRIYRAPLPYSNKKGKDKTTAVAEYLGSFDEKPEYAQLDQLLLLEMKKDRESTK